MKAKVWLAWKEWRTFWRAHGCLVLKPDVLTRGELPYESFSSQTELIPALLLRRRRKTFIGKHEYFSKSLGKQLIRNVILWLSCVNEHSIKHTAWFICFQRSVCKRLLPSAGINKELHFQHTAGKSCGWKWFPLVPYYFYFRLLLD